MVEYPLYATEAYKNFVDLRPGEGAQSEIADYAKVVSDYVKESFPITSEAWFKYRSTK